MTALSPHLLILTFVLPEPCCAYTLQRASWLLPIVDHGIDGDEEENMFDGLYCARIRQQIWNMFENPNSSKAAKVEKLNQELLKCNIIQDSGYCLLLLSVGLHHNVDLVYHSRVSGLYRARTIIAISFN